MKKCYVIPNVEISTVKISFVCQSITQNESGNFELNTDDGTIETLGGNKDEGFGARDRSADFGSLW